MTASCCVVLRSASILLPMPLPVRKMLPANGQGTQVQPFATRRLAPWILISANAPETEIFGRAPHCDVAVLLSASGSFDLSVELAQSVAGGA